MRCGRHCSAWPARPLSTSGSRCHSIRECGRWTATCARTAQRFRTALDKALGKPQDREPLIPVTQRFLDGPLQLGTAAAELGLADPAGLPALFRTPQFAGLGLVSLASAGVVRRDMWEDYYDQVVRQLGMGVPVVPLDGLSRRDFAALAGLEVELKTNKKNNVFAPGDELVIFATNKSPQDIHIELIGSSARGRKVILTPAVTLVKPGQQFRFPSQGASRFRAASAGRRSRCSRASSLSRPGSCCAAKVWPTESCIPSTSCTATAGNSGSGLTPRRWSRKLSRSKRSKGDRAMVRKLGFRALLLLLTYLPFPQARAQDAGGLQSVEAARARVNKLYEQGKYAEGIGEGRKRPQTGGTDLWRERLANRARAERPGPAVLGDRAI